MYEKKVIDTFRFNNLLRFEKGVIKLEIIV